MVEFLRAFLDREARCARAPSQRGGRPQDAGPQEVGSQAQERTQAMNASTPPDDYGSMIEPTTLKIQRLLPGPVERIWAYLTDSDLRRKWLASGAMETKVGAPLELVWRNDELTDPPGNTPPGFGGEHRMASRIVEFDPPRKLA